MRIVGLVVTLCEDPQLAASAVEMLRQAGPFEVGERFGSRLAVVLEGADEFECRSRHEWALELPGVVCVDVAFASFEDASSEDQALDFERREGGI